MSLDFRLNNTLGRSHNTDPDDVLAAKAAFRGLGYYRTPRYGMTPYPDEPLFEGITAFQRDHDLAADGLMKPGGPTAKRLGRVLAKGVGTGANIVAGEHDWQDELWQPKNFGLAGSIGHGRANGRRDVIAAKRALAWAGHYPADRVRTEDGRPDADLFEGLRAFQTRQGLKPDAWMRPGGETEGALEGVLRTKLGDPGNVSGANLLQETDSTPEHGNDGGTGEVQVASSRPGFGAIEALDRGFARGLDRAAGKVFFERVFPLIVVQEMVHRGVRGELGEKALEESSERTAIADPPPPLPGREPLAKPPSNREEFPANPPQLPGTEVLPISGDGESQVWIYPMPPEELTGPQIVENRKGNDETQGEVSRIDSRIRRLHPDWVLIGGGPGKKEFWFPGPGAAWKDE
ncbi:MAG: peptidoglycan-binding protein [Hyphomicrobiales bacterium]|nr:peptidoglycan-binding protein [Hyphomicrobiales bacterium]MCP5373622.1 peptidoglycan-binding protein [Hyphomicrobiales bacterium]